MPFFTSKPPLNLDKKGAPPNPPSGDCDVNLTPYIQVILVRCSPITSSCTLTSLQYQLHHFQLHLCSLIRNTQQASAPHFFKDPLFHLQNAPEPGRKQAPPQAYVFYFLFRPPIGVAAIPTSPHESTLSPILPNHFILHAKSLSPSTGPQ